MKIELPQLNEGEHYAGICIVDGKVSHHLILLPQESPDVTWQEALAWAKGVGGELPTRFEAALLYANLRDKVNDNYWYWTATQYAGYESYAWIQGFGDGIQGTILKVNRGRARAVRRVRIKKTSGYSLGNEAADEIERLRGLINEKQDWIDRAVASCAKRGCSEKEHTATREQREPCDSSGRRCVMLADRAGANPSEWSADLRVREFPR